MLVSLRLATAARHPRPPLRARAVPARGRARPRPGRRRRRHPRGARRRGLHARPPARAPRRLQPAGRMTPVIVGLGPGGPEHRTAAAERAVREADVVIGYGPYVDQCADLLDGQEVVRGAHGRGARARAGGGRARPRARASRWCRRGDAGVHGMAARTLGAWPRASTSTVMPGVTAALAVAARARRAAGRRLGDALALGPARPVGDRRAAPDRARRRRASRSRSTTRARRTRTEPFDRALAILRDAPRRQTRRWWSPPTSRARASSSSTRRWRPSTRRRVTMRSLVLVARRDGRAGGWLVARTGREPRGAWPLSVGEGAA